MKLFWTLEIAVIFTLQTAYLYPQTGVSIGLEETKEYIDQNKWTNIKDWKINIENDKVWFKEDIDFVAHSSFVAPRSGLYYVSLYLEFNISRVGEYFVNVTVTKQDSNKEQYITKSTSDRQITHVKVDDILLIDKNDKITVFLWSSNRNKLTSNSRIFLQFINSYQSIIGFVANPSIDTTISNRDTQVLVGWQTKFDIVNGFSKTTGTYITVTDGYYLVLVKLIFAEITGRLKVQIYENDTKFCNIEKQVSGINGWETITYIGVRKFTSRTKISLKLSSSSKSSYVSIHSTYSIIFLASEKKHGFGVRHYYLKTDTRVPANKKYEIQSWDTRKSKMEYNHDFRVPKSGYYLISLDVYIDKVSYTPPIKLTLQFQYDRVESIFGDGESSRLSLSGVFFVDEKNNIICHIESKETITVLKRSMISIYEITYETHTHLYSLHHLNVDTYRGKTYRGKKKHVLKLMQTSGSNEYLTTSQDLQNIKVIKTGIYYFVLNLFLGNSTKHNLAFNMMHRSVQGSWNLLTSCYVFYSSNCYIPMTLLLYEHEEISIWKSADTDYHEDLTTSFFFVQFIKNAIQNTSFPPQEVKHRTDKSEGLLTKSISLNRNEPFNGGIEVIYGGIYLVTFNVIVRTDEATKYLQRKVELVLMKNDEKLLTLENKMMNTSVINVFSTRTQYLSTGTKLMIRLTLTNNKKKNMVAWEVNEHSYFSILLITKDKAKYLEVDGVIGRELRSRESGEMFELHPKYGKESEYVNYYYTLKVGKSFFALLSVTFIGKCCQCSDANFMKLSVRLKSNKKSWEHMSARKYINGQTNDHTKCQTINLQISGTVIVHRDDMIEVVPILSNKLKFDQKLGTSLSLVVLKEVSDDVPLSYFTSTPIPFEVPPVADLDKGGIINVPGVYEIFLKLEPVSMNPTLNNRFRRDIKDTNSTIASLHGNTTNAAASTTTETSTTTAASTTNTITTNNTATTNPVNNISATIRPVNNISTTINPLNNMSSYHTQNITTTTTTTTTSTPPSTTMRTNPCIINLVITQTTSNVSEMTLILNPESPDNMNLPNILKKELAQIWSKFIKILPEIRCVSCSQEIMITTFVTKDSSFSIEKKGCDNVKASLLMKELSREKDDFIQVYKDDNEDVCNGTGFTVINNWYVNGLLYHPNNSVYQASTYEIIHVYINIFTQQVNQTKLLLVTNGLINDAEELIMRKYSENVFIYQLYMKRLVKRDHSLQIYIDCSNGPVTFLKDSKINIFKKAKLMHMIKDSFPMFMEHPYPAYLNESAPRNYTCSLGDFSPLKYYWNKIDMHTSKWTRYKEHSTSLSIQGTPEESGHYFCSASNNGYESLSDKATVDISDEDECELMKNITSGIEQCHNDAQCINTVGSHMCECLTGFKGDGYVCTDIDECELDKDRCGNNSICTNYDGTFNCTCVQNYKANLTGIGCVDIDECADTERCSNELNTNINITYCVNFPGSYSCLCKLGYQVKDGTCKDVNECHSDPENYPCDNKATCNNTIGSYSCQCDDGYEGNGTICKDVNECLDPLAYIKYPCPGNASCENNNGSYRCICDSGYRGIGDGKLEKCVSLGCFPPHFCAGQYRISWWSRKPYIENTTLVASARGLFRDILTLMIREICKNCSQLYFDQPINGSYVLESLVEANNTDLACPLYGSKEQEKFRGFPFIPIVEAPGVAFFVKDQTTSSSPLVGSLAGSWPILVVTLLLASLSGVIIWFLDTVRNPSEFPHSFLEGSWEGFWWAFITMTTVGYGDKAPRSFFARAFGIIWILIGLVIISTFTATITTVLTASSLSNEAKLYGTKVGALQNSEEFRLGVKRNADVKGYSSVPAIIAALNEGSIQGALLDTYIAGEFQDELQDYKLQEILEHVFVYGVVLARDAERLEKELRTYLERKQSKIYSTISKVVKPLKENKASKAASTQSGALFDADSPFFRTILIAGSAVLGLLLLIGFLWDRCYWRRQREKEDRRSQNDGCTSEKTPIHQSWKTCDVIEYQKHAFKAEVLDLKQQISEFADVWVTRLDEMEGTHEQKLSRVQKWLGRSSASVGGNSLLPNGSSRTKKANGVKGIFPDTEEDAV